MNKRTLAANYGGARTYGDAHQVGCARLAHLWLRKTFVVDVKVTGKTVRDVVSAGGGASESDDISSTNSDWRYHLYISARGRLFFHMPRIDCVDTDPYTYGETTGQVFDLNKADGMADIGNFAPAMPYELQFYVDRLSIIMPPHD